MQWCGVVLGTSRPRQGSDGLGPNLQRRSMRRGGLPINMNEWLESFSVDGRGVMIYFRPVNLVVGEERVIELG